MAVTLPDDIQALLDQAVTDRDDANEKDFEDAQAVQALQAAEENEAAAKNASLQAHQVALASATEFITRITEFLQSSGFEMPTR